MSTAALAIGITLFTTNAKSVQIGCQPAFLTESWALLRLASYGQSPFEHAAFIVREADEAQHFVAWPYHHQLFEATYAGAVPARTVAIIHTHPNSLPLPSVGDAQLALRTRLSVYVVTRQMITRTTGHRTEIVWLGDWNPGQPRTGVRSLCRATSFGRVK